MEWNQVRNTNCTKTMNLTLGILLPKILSTLVFIFYCQFAQIKEQKLQCDSYLNIFWNLKMNLILWQLANQEFSSYRYQGNGYIVNIISKWNSHFMQLDKIPQRNVGINIHIIDSLFTFALFNDLTYTVIY